MYQLRQIMRTLETLQKIFTYLYKEFKLFTFHLRVICRDTDNLILHLSVVIRFFIYKIPIRQAIIML